MTGLKFDPPKRVKGTAVFMTQDREGTPPALLHHLKHNQVLHEKVLLMSVVTEEIPQVYESERVRCRELGQGFYQVVAHYGFMETPDVPAILRALGRIEGDGKPVAVSLVNTTFYLGRETLIAMDGRRREAPAFRAWGAWRAGARSCSSS